MTEEFSLEDALIILKRRLLYFIIPVIIIAPIGLVTVMLLPAKYTASGRILIESQQIPETMIRSTVSTFAQQRIQTIRQRVITREQLLEVANEYDLFPASLGLSESERVRIMRSGLDVRVINSNSRRGNQGTAIAFTVSYTDGDPNKAFLVANRFMTLFLDEDVKNRTAGASNTTEFFQREATRLRQTVEEIEERISAYKFENSDALPTRLNLHMNRLDRARADVDSLGEAISQLEEERRFLETQLVSGATADNDLARQITQLETDLARLRATYHDNYPAVIALRDEINAIKQRMEPSAEIDRLRNILTAKENRLTEVERASPLDEDAVAAAEAEVTTAREALSDRITEESRAGATDLAGMQIEGRIAVVNNRIRMLNKRLEDTLEEIADLEERIARTPEVERGLASLSRDLDNFFKEYQDVLAKQQDAELAESLEENRQAEKFSILEAARRPDKPSSPNRPQLIVLALAAALGAGAATAFLAELAFSTIRGRTHIENLIEEHPIAVVPYIRGEGEKTFSLPFLKMIKPKSKLAAKPA